MTPEELSRLVADELASAVADGTLTIEGELPVVKVERPRSREHGDWATNVAMQLAKRAGRNPRELGELLAARIAAHDGVEEAEVAGPGFVNIRLSAASVGELARAVVEAGGSYGRTEGGAGKTVNLEYVSANPTGPLHIGGARWAAVGDSLARILEFSGAKVVKEYYFNDHGNQIDRFAASLLARARGEDVPEDGYGGQYVTEIAERAGSARAARRAGPRGFPFARRRVDVRRNQVFAPRFPLRF